MNNLDSLANELSVLYQEISSRTWVQYTTGFDLGITAAQEKVKEYLKNTVHYKVITDVQTTTTDPVEARKAEILSRQFKDYHLTEEVKEIKDEIDKLEIKLMDTINKFRAKIDDKEISAVELGKILAQSEDRALRKKAYEAPLPLNQLLVDAGFIQLLNLRNKLAVACGYENFVDYSLDRSELSSAIFRDWTKICNNRVSQFQSKARNLAKKHLELDNLMPWDQAFLKNNISPLSGAQVDVTNYNELLTKTFSKYGFEIANLNLTYDIYPRKNKSEWGYHFSVVPGKDSRILANISNRFSDYDVLLHETAHAAHYMGLNHQETIFNFGISGIVSEGFANFFGSQCYSKEFISEIFKDEPDKAFNEFQNLTSIAHFQNYRHVPDIIFDQQLYLNDLKSAEDIQQLRQTIGKEVLGEEGYQIPWGRLIHHTSHPIYLHNYFLGDIMNENMKIEFSKRFNGKKAEDNAKEFGQFWKIELLAPSGKHAFLDLYKSVLGKEMSITEYIDLKSLA